MSKRRRAHAWFLALAGLVTACTARSSSDDIPSALAVPPDSHFAFEYQALGVQIYACTPSSAGEPAWALTAPDATLYDRKGRKVASHGAGPSWTALDGSQVSATKSAADGGDGTAIPRLLLRATEHSGAGLFADVSYVQRLETRAGLAPSGSCDPAQPALRVPYAATYAFYEPKR